jgi:valyl-tRNA synthetase
MPHVTEEIWTQLPGRESRLIVAPWPEAAATDGDFSALDRAQTAARIYRRSQVRITLEDDALRIFEAVVRPSPDAAEGDIEAERTRLQKEIDRAEKMLANEKFVANADPAAVQAEREKLAQYVAERDALA